MLDTDTDMDKTKIENTQLRESRLNVIQTQTRVNDKVTGGDSRKAKTRTRTWKTQKFFHTGTRSDTKPRTWSRKNSKSQSDVVLLANLSSHSQLSILIRFLLHEGKTFFKRQETAWSFELCLPAEMKAEVALTEELTRPVCCRFKIPALKAICLH